MRSVEIRDETHDDGSRTFLTGDNSTEAMAMFEVGRDQGRVEAHLLVDNHQHFRLDVFTSSGIPWIRRLGRLEY